MSGKTKLSGTILRSGSILPSALGGGVVSSSNQVTILLPASIVSSSAQVQTLLPGGVVSSSAQLPGGVVSSSAQVQATLPANLISSSTQIVANVNSQIIAPQTVNAQDKVAALTGSFSNMLNVGNIVTVGSASTATMGINVVNPSSSLHVSGTAMIQQIVEKVNFTSSAPPSTFHVDLTSGSIFFRSASTGANWTINFRGDAATKLNDILYNGQSITATVLVFNGATAYSASAFQVDGISVIPRWQGGSSASANISSLDAHQYTIMKFASASYHVLGSITKYT